MISRNTDYDSWGEDESDDEQEAEPGAYLPNPYAYNQPPQVVFGAPFPMFYPPPPPVPVKRQKRRKQDENDYDYSSGRHKSPTTGSRKPLGERYEDVNRSVPSKAKRKSKSTRVHFSQPEPPPNGYYGYPGYPGYPAFVSMPPFYPGHDPYAGRNDGRYKVSHIGACFLQPLQRKLVMIQSFA